MPTYEFYCEQCKKTFSLQMKISEHERKRKIQCPNCKSEQVRQQVVAFNTITSKKS